MAAFFKTPSAQLRVNESRRALLKAGAAGGVLLLGFRMPLAGAEHTGDSMPFAPNAFIRIDRAGRVTLIMSQVEMGQGAYTTMAMLLAEELEIGWEQVVVEAAPPDEKLYGHPFLRLQVTGNSSSARAFWMPLRRAGAAARAMLIAAAAKQWKVDPAACRAESGVVIHDASARRLTYAALVAQAALEPVPQKPELKPVADFKLIGKSLKRLDTPDKVNGKALFGIDVMIPGLKFATLAASPVFGGKVAHVDDGDARNVPGVRQVVVLDDLVAVVGDHTWAAKQGLRALKIAWDDGSNATVNTAEVWDKIRAASDKDGVAAKSIGDIKQGLGQGESYSVDFELPFLAHAPMEPMNCTVHVQPDRCEIWVGSQVLARVQSVAARLTGLPLEKVVVHNQLIGGSFGRRLYVDGVMKSVRIAQQVDGPVKVIWSREEDIQHDMYRPVYHDRLTATVVDGSVYGWKHRITGSSAAVRFGGDAGPPPAPIRNYGPGPGGAGGPPGAPKAGGARSTAATPGAGSAPAAAGGGGPPAAAAGPPGAAGPPAAAGAGAGAPTGPGGPPGPSGPPTQGPGNPGGPPVDPDAVGSAIDLPYRIPHLLVEYVREEPPAVPTGLWRGVGPNNNVFAIECFMDDLAHRAGKDPVAFRDGMLDKTPRLRAALALAASKSGWGQPLPARTGRGVAVQTAFASYIATVAEVHVDEQGEVHVRRLTCVVDTGIVINPDVVIAQLQGGLIFGLTSVLFGEITIDKGRVQQSNFHDYRMLRIDQTPQIDVHIIPSSESPGGIGETGTTAASPAVRNAIFAATGIALNRLPIDHEALSGKKKI